MSASDTKSKSNAYPALAPNILLISTKAYFEPSQTLSYLKSLLHVTDGILPLPASSRHAQSNTPPLQLVLIPDFLAIYPCAEVLAEHSKSHNPSSWPLLLGAQNCFWETNLGPYTGEIVPSSLRSLGCSVVELGHAERRRYLSETNETTSKKVAAVCRCGMVPLICVGETSAPAKDGPMSMSVGNALREVGPQVTSVLEVVPRDAPVILAYEPVWAIGAEIPAGVEYVGPVVQGIKDVVSKVVGRTGETRIVYGGSAGPGLWGMSGLGDLVDGMFLGRFAHDINGVKEVIDEVAETIKRRQETS
jgi:triosephosphate isomerase (TIM)